MVVTRTIVLLDSSGKGTWADGQDAPGDLKRYVCYKYTLPELQRLRRTTVSDLAIPAIMVQDAKIVHQKSSPCLCMKGGSLDGTRFAEYDNC